MPNARRIIFSSYIKPTQSIESEETSIRHTEFQSSPNGSLGGKGIVTIDATQWGDGWTSFDHQDSSWDDMNDKWKWWKLLYNYTSSRLYMSKGNN